MKLSPQQAAFTADVARLIQFANLRTGHRVVLKEVLRPEELARIYRDRGIGKLKSLHIKGLAVDLALFIDGIYQTSSEAYRALGEFWESLHSLNRWGGNFKHQEPDGNHFERLEAA